MTRDEAVGIIADLWNVKQTSPVTWRANFTPESVVDALVKLGILKVEVEEITN